MSSYGLTYRLPMGNPKIYTSKFVAISIFMIFYKKMAFSLEFVSFFKLFFPISTPPKLMENILVY